jgi:general secretion pathway protein G
MKNTRQLLRQTGFTLIEMLVTLVIIGLLASLVGPKLFGKLDSSKVQTAQTQVKMLKGRSKPCGSTLAVSRRSQKVWQS